jgi:hypothetical protein
MASALNMTMKLKQDEATRQRLADLKTHFATTVQAVIDTALKESETVHYARVLIIDDLYIQVLTEFDGSKEDYTEFFRLKLQPVFKAIFSLVEGVPSWDEMNDRDTFYRLAKSFNVRALGNSQSGDESEGYLFCAYGSATVKEIQRAFSRSEGTGSGSAFTEDA